MSQTYIFGIELSTGIGLDSNPDLDSSQVDLDLDLDSRKRGTDLDLDLDSRQEGGFGLGLGFEVPGFAHHWCPSFFLYDNDKDLKVCFLVTRII